MSTMSSIDSKIPATRMKSEDRRELILIAATEVFGEFGYVGTTTEKVAQAAEVSQPYVVRMFGTKEKLFLEVINRALERLLEAFRAGLADPGDPQMTPEHRIGLAYVNLMSDRGLLLVLMHAFVLGSDPVIGEAARCGFLEVYEFLRTEAGFTAAQSHQFLANGMLVNTMIGIRMSDEYTSNPLAREMLDEVFPQKLDLLLELGDDRKAAQVVADPEGAAQ